MRLKRAIYQYPIERRSRDTIWFGGDLRASASCHLSVGLLSRGLLDAASRTGMRAVEEARGHNHPFTLCGALAYAAGFIFLSLGALDLVVRFSEELVDRADKHAMRPFRAAGLCIRGSLAVRRGDPAAGVESASAWPRRNQREVSYLLQYPFFMSEYAAALGAIGRSMRGSLRSTRRCVSRRKGNRWFAPEILRVKGGLLALRGSDDPTVIEELFRGSMSLAQEQQALYWELSAAINLGELLRGQHRELEARAVLAPVYDRFTEGFSAARMKRAKMLLDQLS